MQRRSFTFHEQMLPFPANIIGCVGIYLVIRMLYNAMDGAPTYSFGVRFLSILLSYVLTYFFLGAAFQFFSLFYEMFTDPMAILKIFFLLVSGMVLTRIYWLDPEKYQVRELMNFVGTSLTFGNYFRLRDADTRERIGTHAMKRIYEEVHGTPFREEVLATAFDEQVTRFKKVPVEELKKKVRVLPPGYSEQAEQLNAKQITDVSESFRFQLMSNSLHALMQRMQHFTIDPVQRDLLLSIVFPVEQKVPFTSQADRSRLTEQVYEALHILLAEQWFALYAPFISFITVTCRQHEFNEAMTESARELMTFRISLHQLQRCGDRITTASDLMKIAEITYL